jgi:hypothetical protein
MLADVRPLYQNMAFAQAVKKLEAARHALIVGRLPTPGVLRALGDLELWLGACLFLRHDRAGALEHWALAQRLAPGARPDRIFPPEVRRGFAERKPAGKPVSIAVRLAPVDARLWLDGKLVSGAPAAVPGLHYAVAERADLSPVAQIVRVTKAAPEIAISLHEPAGAAEAVRQASARVRTGSLGRDEGLGVSAALHRPLWVLAARDEGVSARRFSAAEVARPTDEVSAPDAGSLVEAICRLEHCAPVAPPLVALAPPALSSPAAAPVLLQQQQTAPPARPVWKRGWFWGVLGASVAVAAGVAVGAALGASAARDYDVRVH